MTPKELAKVLDYPQDKICEMTEETLVLLTNVEEVPGKIIYSTLFSLSSLFRAPQASVSSRKRGQGLSVKLVTNLVSEKRLRLGSTEATQVMENVVHVNVEDVLEDADIELWHEEVGIEEVGKE